MTLKSVSFYVIAAILMVINGLFFSSIVESGAGTNLSTLFRIEALVLMLFLPAITMGAFVKEKLSGTYDFLMTTSLSTFEFVAGKFLAYNVIASILIFTTAQYPFWLNIFTDVDGGRVLAGISGLLLFAFALVSIGLFSSAVAKRQVVASIGAFFLALMFWCAQSLVRLFSLPLSSHIRSVSFFERFIPFAGGLFDYADSVFFIFVSLFFLTMSWVVLHVFRGGEKKQWLKVIMVLFILFFVQAICDRELSRVDLTEEGLFTLSDPMKTVLSEITEPLKIIAFIRSSDPARTDVDGILREMSSLSKFLDCSIIDPYVASDLAKKLKITKERTAVFSIKDRVVRSRGCNEVKLLSGLRRLLRTSQKSVCFLTGHGERDFLSPDPDGIRMFVESLAAAGLTVAPLKFTKSITIPQNCGTLVVVAPQTDLLEREMVLLNSFVDKGGSLLILTEILPGRNWEQLLAGFGFGFENVVLIDPASNIRGLPTEPIITDFRNHPSVSTLEGVALRGVRPLKLTLVKGVRKQGLLYSSQASWGESSLNDEIPVFDDNDIDGPLMVAAVAEKTIGWRNGSEELTGRVIVIGDGDIASNQSFNDLSNAELLLGSTEWLLGYGENVIMLPKGFLCRNLYLSKGQFNLLFLVSVIGVPFIALIMGFIVWFFQR